MSVPGCRTRRAGPLMMTSVMELRGCATRQGDSPRDDHGDPPISVVSSILRQQPPREPELFRCSSGHLGIARQVAIELDQIGELVEGDKITKAIAHGALGQEVRVGLAYGSHHREQAGQW